MTPLRLAVLFGGPSSEHEVSIRSAQSVLAAIDRARFTPIPIGIRRDGQWLHGDDGQPLTHVLEHGQPLIDPRALRPDIVFPVLHGPFGEDGVVQGYLESLGLPYVGSGVLASSVCMDKAMQKHVMAAAAPHIPLVPWVEVDARHHETIEPAIARVRDEIGFPCFSKPANLGSSVGVVKCFDESQLRDAIASGRRYDTKIVIERGINAHEIEVAVLGDGGPQTQVSEPGEIALPDGVWYDYETKYEKDIATYHIPAELPLELRTTIKQLAVDAFIATGCSGLARVDFLLDRGDKTPYLNELNTMPGFTSISMYPQLLEHAGLPLRDLVSRLCELGLARHREQAGRSVLR